MNTGFLYGTIIGRVHNSHLLTATKYFCSYHLPSKMFDSFLHVLLARGASDINTKNIATLDPPPPQWQS